MSIKQCSKPKYSNFFNKSIGSSGEILLFKKYLAVFMIINNSLCALQIYFILKECMLNSMRCCLLTYKMTILGRVNSNFTNFADY